jgi:chain length determinant protein tyrosine kinase EpsG
MRSHPASFSTQPMLADYNAAAGALPACGRPIGQLIALACNLSEEQIEQIVAYQRERRVRFGEAAVALRLADRKDVLEALSQQFQYTTGFAGREANSELVAAADPFSDQADAIRELRSRLLLEVLAKRTHGAIAIVSPDAGDGKTYLAANLAVSFSQLGERTLLIDADLRTPRQHRMLGLVHGPGLSNALAGSAEAGGLVQPVPGLPSLHLMRAGAVPPNPLELLQRPAFGALLQEVLQKFEHVLLDTPAAIRGADSRVIAAHCDATIVIARRRSSGMEPLEGLLAALARGSARVAGVVMNEH